MSELNPKITFKIRNHMITGLSGNDLLLNFRETWLQVVLQECFGLFLVLLTLRHNGLQDVLLMVYESKLSELGSYRFTCFDV